MTASTDSRLRAATCSFRMSRSGWLSDLVKARGVRAISGASQGSPRAFQRASCRLRYPASAIPALNPEEVCRITRRLGALEIGFQEIQKILGYLEAELLQRLRNHFAFRRKPVTNNGKRLPEEPDGKSTLPCASSLSTLVFKATDPAHWRTGSPRAADPRSSSRRRLHSGCQRA